MHERNVIQTAIQGDFGLQRVAADHEIQKRDRGHRQSSYMGELELEEEQDGLLAQEGMSEEGIALMSEAETEAQEAMAAIEHGRRTLKEARARQHEIRMSRKYFKTSNHAGRGKGSGKSAGLRPRDDSQLTCLCCDRLGHRAANCPQRHQGLSPGPVCLLRRGAAGVGLGY